MIFGFRARRTLRFKERALQSFARQYCKIRGEAAKCDFPWFFVPGLFDAPAPASEATPDDPGCAGSSASAPAPAFASEIALTNTVIKKRYIVTDGISASIANIKKVFDFLAESGQPVTARMRQDKGCRFGELMRYYSRQIFRFTRMESYSAKQCWPVYVQDRIYVTIARLRPDWGLKNPRRTKDGPPTSRILFVIGDFKHNSLGHLTMPTATPLFDALRRQGETVCWVKEHRTSKCCSKCGKEMQQAVLHKQLPPTEVELKARARSKQDRQIKRKAHFTGQARPQAHPAG
ncbi:hypothetical protein HK105_204777 [Polyrhizophydium stewartii]|uniref:Transposase n=1 Tax=Polyrhizophydium stewartii TaxID=2732419 RepID=A0ABR4N7T3_9FUNG